MKCPRCHTVELAPTKYEGIFVNICPSCHGFMLSPQALKGIERNPELDKEVLETELNNMDDSILTLTCPKCKIGMRKKDAPYGLDFSLDFCKGCNMIWLDNGELEALQLAFEDTPGGKDMLARRRNMEEMSPERKAQLNANIAKARDYIPNDTRRNGYSPYNYGRTETGIDLIGCLVDLFISH